VAIAALILGIIYLPDHKSPHPLHLDVIGVGWSSLPCSC